MRTVVRTVLVVAGMVLGLAPPAAADPGVGTPTVVTLGDSAISGEGGRWAGNTNQSPSRVDALGSRAYWDTPARDRRGDPRLPPLAGRAGAHRRHREPQPRLLGREDDDRRHRLRPGLQARHRLLLRQLRPPGPGAPAEELRGRQQRARGRGDDRRQQLRLRGDRRTLRDQLADVAVVVQELLQRRRLDDVALHRRAPGDRDRQRARRVPPRRPGHGRGRLRDLGLHDHRPDLLVADPARQRLPLPGDRLDAAVDRRLRDLEPRRRLGQRHGHDRDEQQRQERRGELGPAERRHARPLRIARRAAAVRVGRRPARGDRHGVVAEHGRGRPQRVGRARSARSRRSSARTSCRRAATRATGVSWRCATACARPTTAARSAAASACGSATG